jgi:hypothetical protein
VAAQDTTTKGLWGRVVPIPDNGHPRLFWTQAEVDQLRTQLLTYHSPSWLWDRYTQLYQGVLAIPPDCNHPNDYEPWRTNTRAAITYMLEPTQAKADAIRAALLAFPSLVNQPGFDGDWFQSPCYGFSGFPNALMYDLLLAYHPNTMSASEKQSTRDYFKYSSGADNGNFYPRDTDAQRNWVPPVYEGIALGEYVNSFSNDIWNHLPQAIMSGDQFSIDYWADSGWPHDRFTYDGNPPVAAPANRFDLVMFIRTLLPSGANLDSHGRERFEYIPNDFTSWYTNCYNCANDPTGQTYQDDGSYHYFQFNTVAASAMIAYHNGMTGVFSGFPGQQILGNYLLGVATINHHDYRPTSKTGHPDLYTYMSTYLAMRVFSDRAELQNGQQYWYDSGTNSATQADPLAWPFFGQPYGTVGGVIGPQTYYVDAGASAGNACAGAVSSTTPVNTITKGLGCLAAGDTLSIASGTYAEQLPDSIPSGTNTSTQTTVKAATPGGVVVRPTSLPSGATIMPIGTTQSAGRSFLTIQGLTIDGSQLPVGTRTIGLAVGSTSTGGARTGSHDILLDQIRVVDLPNNNAACGQSQPSTGIQVGQADWKVTLQHVTISNIGRGAVTDPGTCAPDHVAYGVGIAFGGSDSLLTDLDITQTQAHALTFRGLSAGGANIVRTSYVHGTGAGILLACGGQSSVQVTNQLYNTIIASSGTFGQAPQAHSLVLGGACGGQTSTTTLVANSTIWNGKGSCVYVSGTSDGQASTNNTLRNLLCYANETNQVTVGSGATGTTIDHNLTTQDPLFVHTPPQQPTDFQVQVSPTKSPAIDTGIAVATATTSDYGGTLRPQPVGGVWDIGAWEAGPPPPVGGLVGHWPFDEGSSTTANDTTGVRPLTFPASTLTWTTGHVGPFALGCDGVNGAQHPTPFTLAQHTVMFWWWAQAAPGTTGRQVVANGASGTVASPVLVWSFSWGHWTATNRQAWTLYDGANTWTVLQYPTTLTPQTWYHLAATYDGTTYRAYLNGQPSLSKVGPGPGTPQGAFMVCSGGGGAAESGQVDDLKVWNRALSDTEIAQQYAGQGGHRRQHRVVAQ